MIKGNSESNLQLIQICTKGQFFHKSIKIVFDGGILIIKDNDNEQFKVCFKSGVDLVL